MLNPGRHAIHVAVYLFLFKENTILLAKRKNTGFADGQYSVIAGHVDEGESITSAIIREAKEEANVIVTEKDISLSHILYSHGKYDYINFFFTASHWQGTPTNMEADKCEDMDWFLLSSLPENTLELIRVALKNKESKLLLSEYGF